MTEFATTTPTTPTDWTDADLLSRMLTKEPAAWGEFHRRFDRLVYRCIHKVTGRFSSVVASEDVREIFGMFLVNITARDMHKLRRYQPERGNKLSSWIGLLATNTAWDYLRSLSRQPQTTELTEAAEVRASMTDPSDLILSKQRWALVNRTLCTFSIKDRDFVRLFYVEGMSPEEVAEEMAISVKTVYSKKHKIRCRLTQALAPAPMSAAA
jgi:RNA polymerase sigma-70 factor (ECF subfamily)